MKISKLAGVVVLYEPDELLISRIDSYLGILQKLFIIDNSVNENSAIRNYYFNYANVEYYFIGNNIGMAAALNLAARLSLLEDFSWLLTMDQDSSFSKEAIVNYRMEFERISILPEICAIGINHDPNSSGSQDSGDIAFVNAVITSGSLIKLSTWATIGGFNENLFIDEVDHEYCYRLIQNGLKVVKLNNIILNHQMGHLRHAGYLGLFMIRRRMIHSPIRIYYIVRNYLYVRKLFRVQIPSEFENRDREVKVILKNNLFFSGNIFGTLRMALKGFQDYRNGVFGKYNNK